MGADHCSQHLFYAYYIRSSDKCQGSGFCLLSSGIFYQINMLSFVRMTENHEKPLILAQKRGDNDLTNQIR